MKKIQSIARYNSAYEVLEDFCGMDFWNAIDADDDCFLRNFDNFEGYNYYCINGETMLMTDFSGDVIGTPVDFSGFLSEILKLLEADREDRKP